MSRPQQPAATRALKHILCATTIGALSLGLAACGSVSAPTGAQQSPLEAYLGAIYGDMSPEGQEERQRKIEDSVASCMQEQGFEYTPNVQSGGVATFSRGDFQSREFVEEFGYGYVTMMSDPSGDEAPADPNADYVESLSGSEQAAYQEALYGKDAVTMTPAPDAEGESGTQEVEAMEDYDPTEHGCYGIAVGDEFGGPMNDEKYSELFAAMDDLWRAQQDASEVAEKLPAWAECMAGRGYDEFEKPDDANAAVSERATELWQNGDQAPSEEAVKPVREFELAVALADFECAESSGLAKAKQDTQFRLETEFIKAHQSELDALVAEYGQGE